MLRDLDVLRITVGSLGAAISGYLFVALACAGAAHLLGFNLDRRQLFTFSAVPVFFVGIFYILLPPYGAFSLYAGLVAGTPGLLAGGAYTAGAFVLSLHLCMRILHLSIRRAAPLTAVSLLAMGFAVS